VATGSSDPSEVRVQHPIPFAQGVARVLQRTLDKRRLGDAAAVGGHVGDAAQQGVRRRQPPRGHHRDGHELDPLPWRA
jgi:hypothetical protein